MAALSTVRAWARNPRWTIAVLLCLAVSVAGAGTVLTFAYSLLARPLPFPEGGRLAIVEPLGLGSSERAYLSYPNFADLRERLRSFDKDKDGRLSLDEMSGEIALTFGRGGSAYGASSAGFVQVRQPGGPNQPASTPPGPKWFVHMDRNGDGDVTLREFLGTPEQFQKLDANADGFISLNEAAAASPGGDDQPAIARQR